PAWVRLRAAPEIVIDLTELSAELCGKRLRTPLMIVGMTGGTERAGRINRDLASLAEEAGVAFGVGSMRILLEQPDLLATFAVKPARPPLLAANLGAQQLVQRGTGAALRVMEMLEADAIAIHLNAAQELVQAGGDRDFRGCLDAIGELVAKVGAERVIVKETGCGIGPAVLRELAARGVRTTDVSGAGGTSWPRVEQLRARDAQARGLGGTQIIGSGGLRSGLDAAKALALGADVAGFALPLVRAHQQSGIEGARAELAGILGALRAAFLLCGARDAKALRASRRVILDPLRTWIEGLAG